MAYIKSIDEDAWLAILKGWSCPIIEAKGKKVEKPQKDWTDEEKKKSVSSGLQTPTGKSDNDSLLEMLQKKYENLASVNKDLIIKLNESEASQKFLQVDLIKRDETIKQQTKFIEELQKEVSSIKLILKNLEKGNGKLDEILSVGKPNGDKRGLGYDGDIPKTQTVFVKEGDLGLLSNITKHESRQVTFGDGVKGTIIGKGTLNVIGLPKVEKCVACSRSKSKFGYH
ncbi:hypothetical protein H6P81_016241 [Aristolochia fimbriata]|uniref:Uncharacterized protein n=1 Tax=Aristolochia fimbriata TaxID=158543 RepID=A0AAV7EAU0_ARIFI|nr:hypothetical protein H6P81_016241 [Aristolochia fimbriata]